MTTIGLDEKQQGRLAGLLNQRDFIRLQLELFFENILRINGISAPNAKPSINTSNPAVLTVVIPEEKKDVSEDDGLLAYADAPSERDDN